MGLFSLHDPDRNRAPQNKGKVRFSGIGAGQRFGCPRSKACTSEPCFLYCAIRQSVYLKWPQVSAMKIDTRVACTMLSAPCVFLARAAVVARISTEEYSGARFRTLAPPFARAAKRSGSTQVFGHSRQAENH